MNIELSEDYSLNKFYDWIITFDSDDLMSILRYGDTILRNFDRKLNTKEFKPKKICFLLYENIEKLPNLDTPYFDFFQTHNRLKNIDIYVNDGKIFRWLKMNHIRAFRYYPSNDFEILGWKKRFSLNIERVQYHFTNLSFSRHDHNYEIHKFLTQKNLLPQTVYSYSNGDVQFEHNYNRYLEYHENNYQQFKEKFMPGNTANSEMSDIDIDLHAQSVFTINKETVYHGHGPHYSEKLVKSVAAGRPFIEVSCPHTLQDLKETMGLYTFDDIIDESYDKIEDPYKRMAAIQNEINRLANIPLKTLIAYIKYSKDKLEHNYNVLQDFYKTAYNFNRRHDHCILEK